MQVLARSCKTGVYHIGGGLYRAAVRTEGKVHVLGVFNERSKADTARKSYLQKIGVVERTGGGCGRHPELHICCQCFGEFSGSRNIRYREKEKWCLDCWSREKLKRKDARRNKQRNKKRLQNHWYRNSEIERQVVIIRDKGRCQYCGSKPTGFDITFDHLIPKSRGGCLFDVANIVLACRSCNAKKWNRTPLEFFFDVKSG